MECRSRGRWADGDSGAFGIRYVNLPGNGPVRDNVKVLLEVGVGAEVGKISV